MMNAMVEFGLPAGSGCSLSGHWSQEQLEPVMWLNTSRVIYVGLLGEPSERSFGSYAIYMSFTKPHKVSVAGGLWEECEMSVVAPYVQHRVISGERMICCLLVEADSVNHGRLPDFLRYGAGAVDAPEVQWQMRNAIANLRSRSLKQYANTAEFDEEFFGAILCPSDLDHRIEAAIEWIKKEPNGQTSAKDLAESSHLSVSRFLHLFKADVGASFRSFRAWQRARSVLYHVTASKSLTNIALDVGYPDSSHFSHSIRQTYGLTPRSIFAGSRKLELHRAQLSATA